MYKFERTKVKGRNNWVVIHAKKISVEELCFGIKKYFHFHTKNE